MGSWMGIDALASEISVDFQMPMLSDGLIALSCECVFTMAEGARLSILMLQSNVYDPKNASISCVMVVNSGFGQLL